MEPRSDEEIKAILDGIRERLRTEWTPEKTILNLNDSIIRYKEYMRRDPNRGFQWRFEIMEAEAKIRQIKMEIENERNKHSL